MMVSFNVPMYVFPLILVGMAAHSSLVNHFPATGLWNSGTEKVCVSGVLCSIPTKKSRIASARSTDF